MLSRFYLLLFSRKDVYDVLHERGGEQGLHIEEGISAVFVFISVSDPLHFDADPVPGIVVPDLESGSDLKLKKFQIVSLFFSVKDIILITMIFLYFMSLLFIFIKQKR